MEKRIEKTFLEKFGETPLIVRSPGRINLIGEHTDYNEGFVLPAAIDMSVYAGISKRSDNKIVLYALSFNEEHLCSLSTMEKDPKLWPNYILGIVDQLQKKGYPIGGINLVIDGDIPYGAGLSSSAAVECAVIFGLNMLFGLRLDLMQMVKLAQNAEHEFAGVKCGIMDQFASMHGKKDHAIKLDCRSLHYEYIPLDLQGYRIVLFNTNVKHSLVASAYNERRQQCEDGVRWIREFNREVNSLRDADMHMLHKYVLPKDKLVYKRCKYVVEENERLQAACEDLRRGNLKELGTKMFLTHQALSEEYEVSCRELDFLVDAVKNNPNVPGARMMGGGFGGCTINIVREEEIEELTEIVSKAYRRETGIELTTFIAGIEDGTSIVKLASHATV